MTTAPLSVLVIDDQAVERRVLEEHLKAAKASVTCATSGRDGIHIARSSQPDVILLDILMQDEIGLDVCAALKTDPLTKDIPVIFITSLDSRETLIKGLKIGAADFLNKPVDGEALIARVQTHGRMRRQHLENIKLARELEQARRKAEVMHITEGIAHNLNNLLGVIIGYLSLLQQAPNDPQKVSKNCSHIEHAAQRMTKIVRQLSIIGQFRAAELRAIPLNLVLQGAVTRYQRNSDSPIEINVENNLPDDFMLSTNREIIEPCIEQLLQNAAQSYGRESHNNRIRLVAERSNRNNSHLLIRVIDSGCGIPPDLLDSAFDPFVSSSAEVGKGMGLTLAKHAANSLHADIDLIPIPEGGTEARLSLPLD